MKRFLAIIAAAVLVHPALAQPESPDKTLQEFKTDFQKAPSSAFTDTELNKIFSNYPQLFTPADGSKNDEKAAASFPLESLKNEPYYAATIKSLMRDSNPLKNTFAYLVLASAGDKTHNDELLSLVKSDKDKDTVRWAGFALLYLRDNHTDELFDYLVKYEEFGDPHMVTFFLQLDKDSLRKTALKNISSTDKKARVLAVQTLSVTGLEPKTEQAVREAVSNWPPETRGYAIFTLRALGVSKIKKLLQPSLDITALRGVSLAALANSPTPEDQAYLASMIPHDGEIPKDILDAYLQSTRIESLQKWLQLVTDGHLPENYVFFTFDQPLFQSEQMATAVKKAIRNTKNPQIVADLLRTLDERHDDDTEELRESLKAAKQGSH